MHRLTSVIANDPRVAKFMRLPDAQLSAILEAHDFYVETVTPEIPVPSQTLIDSLTDDTTSKKPVVPPVVPPKPALERGVYWKHPKTGKLNGPFKTPDEAIEAATKAKVTKPDLVENP
jgi:hypothetical protein